MLFQRIYRFSIIFLINMLLSSWCCCHDFHMDRADKLHFPPFSNVTSFRKFSPISLSRCIHECKARSRCDAINYSKSWKLCDLIGGPLESAGGSRKGFVGGRKADWNMTTYTPCNICGDGEVCNILLNNSVTCHKEECGFPPRLLYANHVGNIYNVGSNICYSCQDGYVNVGGNTSCSRCSETGVWTAVNIQCESTLACENIWIGYGGHCYLEYTEEEDWCDAQSYCRSHGGYLLSIETESENNFIEGTFPDGSYWIGGNDLAVEGVYVWDSGNALTFANWNVYQPDSYTGDEDCLWANSDWRWHDRKCHRPFKSICEKEPSNSLDAGSTTPPSVSSSTSISTGTVCITTTSATISTSTTTTAVTTSPTSTSTTSTTTSSTTSTTTTTPPPTCPSGWIQYQNHCYLQVNARRTWFDAQSNCRGYSGYLLSIETAEEYDFIRNDNSFDAGIGWLGGTDADTEGVWMWDSGAEVTLDHWQPYQPDNNYNADCMAVNIAWNSWEWDDQTYHNEYRSVCEIDLANV